MAQENKELKDFEKWVRETRKLMKTGDYYMISQHAEGIKADSKDEGFVVKRTVADIRRIERVKGVVKRRLFDDDIHRFKYICRCKQCGDDFISDADYDEICEVCEAMKENSKT